MTIQFQFHSKKAVEAAGLLLKFHGKPMHYLSLLKMLYIADRLALQRMDQPITGDNYIAIDHGLVPKTVYDLIQGNPVNNHLSLWSKFISLIDSSSVSLISDPGNEELCQEEEAILAEVYQTFGHLHPLTITEWTYAFPEWQNPYGSAIPIPIENILHYLGKTTKEIQEIEQIANREAYLDQALHG